MKSIKLRCVFLFILLITFLNTSWTKSIFENDGFAVVELFTSESCSSCPSAEKVVASLHEEFKDVCFLEFHVDYWDYLGWKDLYSNKNYTERQLEYVRLFGLNSCYTPQAIVNGRVEMVGSDKSKLKSTIIQQLKNDAVVKLAIKAMSNDKSVVISYSTGSINQILNIALVQRHTASYITNGENSGRRLDHNNVVRVFKSVIVEKEEGRTIIDLPTGLAYNDCRIIAYLQNKKNFNIIAGKEVEINN